MVWKIIKNMKKQVLYLIQKTKNMEVAGNTDGVLISLTKNNQGKSVFVPKKQFLN